MKNFITILITAVVTATCTYAFTTNYRIVPLNVEVDTEPETTSAIELEDPEEMTEEQEWSTYSNSKFEFAFAYPPNTIIEDPKVGRQSTYIRLQNYNPIDDRLGLLPGEYYLEIWAFDPELDHTPYEACTDESIRHITEQMGDAGGQRWRKCFKKNDKTVVINVTENSEVGLLANEILESLEY